MRRLSPARDMDVWILLLCAGPAPRAPFLKQLVRRQRGLKAQLVRQLDGHTFCRLKTDTRKLLARSVPAVLADVSAKALRRTAAEAWRGLLDKVRKRGRGLTLDHAEAAHRLRIACRRARYLAEFFALVPAPATTQRDWIRTANRYRAVQDALGVIHDLDTLCAFVRRQRIPLPARFAADLPRRRAKSQRDFRRAWRRLDKVRAAFV